MSDFHQNGVVTVLHRLGQPNLDHIEKELERYSAVNPVALTFPALYSELERTALKGICEHLRQVRYLKEIVVAFGKASALEFRRAKDYFRSLPQTVRLGSIQVRADDWVGHIVAP